MWLWTADHMIDDPLLDDANNNMDMLGIFTERGILIESQKSTWLYGTSSEHSTLYQYNFYNASNIFTTFLQTETPYYQPNPLPPLPFKITSLNETDPPIDKNAGNVSNLDSSWAVVMRGCENIHIAAAGTYSFFQNFGQSCVDGSNCQKSLWLLYNNHKNIKIEQVVTIGAQNMVVTPDEVLVPSDKNLAVTKHPKWSHITELTVEGKERPIESCSTSIKPWKGYRDGYTSPVNMTMADINNPAGTHLWRNETNSKNLPAYMPIVNFTPYKFIYQPWKTPYQLEDINFQDVESGTAAFNTVAYKKNVGNYGDTNGFFNYTIAGTNKRFTVHVGAAIANTTSVSYDQRVVFDLGEMGLGWGEYGVPAEVSPVTLIIMGSEEYGYTSSLQFQPFNWMHAIKDVIGDNELRHVVMPGSHDAGMDRISLAWQFFWK